VVSDEPAGETKGAITARPTSGRPSSGRRPGTAGAGGSRPHTSGSNASGASSDTSTPKASPGGSHNRVHKVC
jgi:hypothetical protein